MKNPHIELVKKWLDNPKSVSLKELERAADAANAAAADAAADARAATYAARAAADARAATYAAADARAAKHWVEKYEELTK